MKFPRTLAVCLAALCAMSLPAAAQQNVGPSLEGSVGLRYGSGGNYTNRAGAAVDLLATAPIGQISGGTLIAGLSGGASGTMAVDDVCVVGPNQECLSNFPGFVSVAALAGFQQPLGSGSLRLLVGPGYYQAHDLHRVVGVQGRADVSTPRVWRVSLVGSVRANLLPRFEGEMLRLTTFGVGLRIH